MFLSRSIKTYLCLNMIHFDGVIYSEGRCEEVIVSFDAQCITKRQDFLDYLIKYVENKISERKLVPAISW